MNVHRCFPRTVLRAVVGSVLSAALTTACATGGGPSPESAAPRPGPEQPPDTAEDARSGAGETGQGEVRPAGVRLTSETDPVLPPIPSRRGPIDLEVVYPGANRLVRPDSNFIFGSVGTGDALLRIDGHPVDVEPNGAFLAWLPVPDAGEGDRVARYRLEAWRPEGAGAGRERDAARDTVIETHPVRRPDPPFRPPNAGAWIDPGSARPSGLRWLTPGEPVDVSLRAAPGGRAWFTVRGERFPMTAPRGSDRFRASPTAESLARAHCGGSDECLRGPEPPEVAVEFFAAADGDTVRLERALRLRILDPRALPVVELEEAPNPEHGRSGRVVGRPTPHGTYAWRFPVGTRAELTARRGDRLRLAVPGSSPAWVSAEDARILPEGTPRPRAVAGDLRVEPQPDRLRIEVPLASAVPVTVDQPDADVLAVRLHGVRAGIQRVEYGPADPLLERVDWSQAAGPTAQLEFGLSEPLWGYELRWLGEAGPAGDPDAGRRLLLEIRRPPDIDPEAPLRGRTVAVDPGHPGAGAHGPTGYYEGDANLAIARRLAGMLREAGARPILIRDDTLPMGLYERTNRAVDVGAEIFVSIHNNALPDGVYPFGEEGTSTYYYHPHARELAESVQAGMLLHMGLRDLGIFWGNLAVARLSWMPAVLAEGAFMMFPRHEAALKTARFQRAYARGVLKGIQGFLARRADEVDGN